MGLGSLAGRQHTFAYFDDDPDASERLPVGGDRSCGAPEQYDGRPEFGVVFGWTWRMSISHVWMGASTQVGVVMDMDHTDLTCMNGGNHIDWSGGGRGP